MSYELAEQAAATAVAKLLSQYNQYIAENPSIRDDGFDRLSPGVWSDNLRQEFIIFFLALLNHAGAATH